MKFTYYKYDIRKGIPWLFTVGIFDPLSDLQLIEFGALCDTSLYDLLLIPDDPLLFSFLFYLL